MAVRLLSEKTLSFFVIGFGYNYLLSNKWDWNNCFTKKARQI